MKIIYWLDLFLINFCLANSLQKKVEAKNYAIIDTNNRPKKFFNEQRFVNFEKKWFYFDHVKPTNQKPDIDYLTNFENKYKINLWKLVINERMFYRFNRLYKFTSDEILSILEQECKFFEKIIDEINPDFMVTYDPPLHHHKLFFDLCKAKGVKVLCLFLTRVDSKCVIADDPISLGLEFKSQDLKKMEIKVLKNLGIK